MATKGAVVARIISEYSDKGTRAAQKDINRLGNDFANFSNKVGKAFTFAAAASAAFAVKVGIDSVKAAMADQKSQALLANSLRNTAGASTAVIDSVEKYINKQQLALGVQDDELRPSLAALATATHDVAKAQELQSLALDISANRHADLSAVSIALAKAYAGNFNALKRLGIPLSENLIKSKDFVGITKELAAATGGAAAAAADTFAGRLERMQLGFKEAKESLGYALLPALTGFVNTLNNDILPKVQKWIDLNKDKLAKSLKSAADEVAKLLKNAVAFGTWITDHMGMVKAMGILIAAMWSTAKIASFISAIGNIIAVMRTLAATAAAAAIAEAFATAGVSAITAAAAITAVGLTTWRSIDLVKGLGKETEKTGKITQATNMQSYGDALKNAELDKKSAAARARQAIADKAAARAAAAQAAADAAAKAKAAAQEALVQKELLALKKLGITVTSTTDPVELEAARLNLVKQGNIAEQNRFAAIIAAADAQMRLNTEAQKYNDLLAVLSDKNVSFAEVEMLAQKWSMSKEQVIAYIAQITGAVSYDKSLTDPAGVAAKGWKDATAELDAYLATLKKSPLPAAPGTGTGGGATTTPTPPPAIVDQSVIDSLKASGDYGLAFAIQKMNAQAISSPTSLANSTANFGVSNASLSAAGATGSGGTTNIYNINGSYVTQADLTSGIRNNLLQGQLSGQVVSFSSAVI